MRISTNTMFEVNTARMGESQSSLLKLQQQLATGKRILSPSDDPVGAAQSVELTQSQSINGQFAVNRQNARNSLGAEEGTLQSVTSLLQDVKTLVVNAGNGVLSGAELDNLGTELEGRFNELMGLANARDGAGNYIFAGYHTASQPFAQTPTGATYTGDEGTRVLQVGPSRQMPLNDSGSDLFDRVRDGNGTFVAAAANGNTGSGITSAGVVLDSAALTGHQYSLKFTTPNSYDLVDTTTSTTVSSGNAFMSGKAIAFDGMQFEISGAPAAGDTFTVSPSANKSIFTTMTDLINLLKTPVSGAAGRAKLANGLSSANGNIDHALDKVLTARASVGSRLRELDTLDVQGDDRNLQYAQSLSVLQDLDYNKAITDFSKQKMMLDAAQQAFVKTANLTLFDYIR